MLARFLQSFLGKFYGNPVVITLLELKLQGMKVCDGVVFSRYSQDKCFPNYLSSFVRASGRALDLYSEDHGINPQWGLTMEECASFAVLCSGN